MKSARIIVLGVAVVAGGLAAVMAGRQSEPTVTAPVEVAAPRLDTTEVLVAKADIGLGQSVTSSDMQWQTWPVAAAGPYFIRKTDKPNAQEELSGSIARAPLVAGEPMREAKLIKADGSGFMAAILPSGKRAVSTEISPETGAGGFILPNDRVDVLLSRRDLDAAKSTGRDTFVSETILNNIRVLAIDQTVEEKNGQKVVVGKTATLELAPRQAETLAMSRQMGTLSLALRSLADGNKGATDEKTAPPAGSGINTVRFGVTTTVTPK
jgi:pilus assembly protein CpaB